MPITRDGKLQPPYDELVIEQIGRSKTRSITLDKKRIKIGKDISNDVALSDQTISRKHAEIRLDAEGGGWVIVDLGSTNGTELDGSKLLPRHQTVWTAGLKVRIGPFFLVWRSAENVSDQRGQTHSQPNVTQTDRPVRRPVSSTEPIHGSELESPIELVVTPQNVTLDGGKTKALQVRVANRGDLVEHVDLSVSGLNGAWYSFQDGQESASTSQVNLMPAYDNQDPLTQNRTLILRPPRSSQATAKLYKFQVVAKLRTNSRTKKEAECSLTINPFDELELNLQPTKLENKRSTILTLTNKGNRDRTYRITGRDEEDILYFGFSDDGRVGGSDGVTTENRFTVEAGRSRQVAVLVSAVNRMWWGRPIESSFSLMAQGLGGPESEAPERVAGRVKIRPILSRQLLSILSVLSLLLCGTSTISYRTIQNFRTNMNATATAQEIAAITQTAEVSMTAIAGSDADGDGLTYLEEMNQWGTNPNIADTDKDGLLDGAEAKQHNTNPINEDSDGDGLTDGEEVKGCTFPNNEDTDEDGIKDREDPAPCQKPTATPTPSATPTNPPPTSPPLPTLPPPTPTKPPTPPETFLDVDKTIQIEWVYVPAGAFLMGGADGDGEAEAFERPIHWINYLPGYWISKTEITNEQYRVFLEQQQHRIPPRPCKVPEEDPIGADTNAEEPPKLEPLREDLKKHPVICVSQEDAVFFAQWVSAVTGYSVSLPSEAEWEKAARGTLDTRLYPWGNSFNGFLLNYCDISCNEDALEININDGADLTVNVGSYPNNASPYGALDMSGNVLEWTRSIWGSTRELPDYGYPYNPNDGRESGARLNSDTGESLFYVIRGGGWITARNNVRVSSRERLQESRRHEAVGFRLVLRTR